MARNWTPEERRKQSEAVQNWKPWKQSTGPKTESGKLAVCKNSYTHGFRSADMQELRRVLRLQRDYVRAVLNTLKSPI